VDDLAVRYGMNIGERGTTNRDELWKVTVPDTFKAISRAITGRTDSATVWDRLFFSEMIYAPLYKRPCQFSIAQQAWIRGLLVTMEVPIIMCMPPRDVCYTNMSKGHQMEGVEQRFRDIYDRYRVMTFPPNTVRYDYVNDSLQIVYDRIGNYLKRRRLREW